MAIITETIANIGEEVEETGTFIHCWWGCKRVRPLFKTVWQVLEKVKHSYYNSTFWYIPKRNENVLVALFVNSQKVETT